MDAASRAAEFASFVRAEYAPTVRRVAPLIGEQAEDVAQEAFIAAFRRWDHVRSLQAPHAWVQLVARRIAWSTRSRERARPARELAAAGEPFETDATPTPGEAADVLDVARAIEDLPARQRLAVRLYYGADLPITEVAATLGMSEAAAKVLVHRARNRLAAGLMPIVGTWVTASRWEIDDEAAALRRMGARRFEAPVIDATPLGDGHWILRVDSKTYSIETDFGLRLDYGRARIIRGGLQLLPWDGSGVVELRAELAANRARFEVFRDTTAPTRGVPDEVFQRLILGSRIYERQSRA